MGKVNQWRQECIDADIEKYLEDHPEAQPEEAHEVVMRTYDRLYDLDPS
jgi:hypothetical protein